MGRYRSSLQIVADVLSVAAVGAKKVQIMYKANLSYELLVRYLAEVLDAGLVSFEGSAGHYRLTRKGEDFLKRYDEYEKRCRKLEGLSNDVERERAALEGMCFNAKQMDKSDS